MSKFILYIFKKKNNIKKQKIPSTKKKKKKQKKNKINHIPESPIEMWGWSFKIHT